MSKAKAVHKFPNAIGIKCLLQKEETCQMSYGNKEMKNRPYAQSKHFLSHSIGIQISVTKSFG